jgi:hypothetical protein
MSCTYFTRLRRTLSVSVAAISSLITLVPVAAGAVSLGSLTPDVQRNIVITMDKDPRVVTEAACTAVTAARVLGQGGLNDVTLLLVRDGVIMASAEALNGPELQQNKCTVPDFTAQDPTANLVEVTLKENLEGFLGCDTDTNGDDDCKGDNHQGGFAHLFPCFLCWKTRFGDAVSDYGVVAPDLEVPAILDGEQILGF